MATLCPDSRRTAAAAIRELRRAAGDRWGGTTYTDVGHADGATIDVFRGGAVLPRLPRLTFWGLYT